MTLIKTDYANAGISPRQVASYEPLVQQIHYMLEEKTLDFTGWVDYPQRVSPQLLNDIKTAARQIRSQCSAFVICGVGGSYLGAKAAVSLLTSTFHNEEKKADAPKIYFAGHHLAPTYYAELLHTLSGEDVALCVISKSGKTMETSIAFNLLKDLLYQKYGDEAADRIYVVTDETSGLLRQESDERGYTSFALDGDIGGRYSVLTPVGLLPMAVAGIDIDAVLLGACEELEAYRSSDFAANACYDYAVCRRILDDKGKVLEVYASFEPKLQYFGEWLKQLFGESEGKEGKGLFPAFVQFSSDLHSLGQFLQEGRPIFFETVLMAEEPQRDLTVKDPLVAPEGRSLHEINRLVERAATAAHIAGGAPNIFIKIPRLDAHGFGQLVYFFERACAVSGLLLGVDPFDQPGVEKYKANVRELLGK